MTKSLSIVSLYLRQSKAFHKDYNYFFGNDKFFNLYKRLLHGQKCKSGHLEKRIYERPLKSEPNFIENQSEHILKLSLHQSLVKRKFIHCDFF